MFDVSVREKLAINGGIKTINKKIKPYNTIGLEERQAVDQVMKTGVLSKFLGCWDDDFYGGPKVQELEAICQDYFSVKHAISVNSWTSGLIAAVGAIGIEPGDEIIVSPWTMCASATAILHWNAIPVFADIEPRLFCIDPCSIEKNITDKTKAIMAIDIFGQSADMDAIMQIAAKYGLKVISDTAQAPGAFYKDKYAGTMADIGGYSLNYHKHIHCGEGGVLITNDDDLAERLKLIRNHGEAVVADKGTDNLTNIIGYNFRLGEIESAIAIEQLKKLKTLIEVKQQNAMQLSNGLQGLKGLRLPEVRSESTHVFYIYPLVLDLNVVKVDRQQIVDALKAEGVPDIAVGYANIHLLPMFQNKIAYGSKGFPWKSDICDRDVNYSKGICPVAEELYDSAFFGLEICCSDLTSQDIDLIIKAFRKVWAVMIRDC